jgi:hypothetical protein
MIGRQRAEHRAGLRRLAWARFWHGFFVLFGLEVR